MAQISKSVATLRIMGENLIPSEITSILGCRPSYQQEKGQIIIGKKTGRKRVVKFGMWRLAATDKEPENIDMQISEIPNRLSPDISVWETLASRYEIDLFCGLFMEENNEGMQISPTAFKALGDIGIVLSLDIYDGNDEAPANDDLCPCGSGKTYSECCKKGA